MEDRNKNRDENVRSVENSRRPVSQRDAQPRSPLRDREPKEAGDRAAELDGKKGKIETEHTEPTGRTSAIPGNTNPDAKKTDDEGTASSGAGLGGNKGTGTRNKKDFT